MLNRNADARTHTRMEFAEFVNIAQHRATAREDNAANQFALVTRTANFPNHVVEDFLHTCLYNTCKIFFGNLFVIASFNARNRDNPIFNDFLSECRTEFDLQLLGLVLHHRTAFFDVGSHNIAAERHNRRVANDAFLENRDVRRAAADVNEGNACFFFFIAENGNCRSNRFEGHAFDLQTCAFNATVDVVRSRNLTRNDVEIRL